MFNLTIEDIEAEYLNKDYIIDSAIILKRVDRADFRYYYTLEPFKIYPSVTTVISKGLPTSPYLIDWKVQNGKDFSEEYTRERATYGTLMHMMFNKFLLEKEIIIDDLDSIVDEYCSNNGYKHRLISWQSDIKKDVMAFAQFCYDYELKVLAVESPVVYGGDLGEWAGCNDLIAEITVEEKGFFGDVYKTGKSAGKPKETKRKKRVVCIIDHKSSRKGSFYDSHNIQLNMYKKAVEQSMNISIDKLFNFSPKDWRDKPSYTIKEQSLVSDDILRSIYTIFNSSDNIEKKRVSYYTGKIFLGEPVDEANCKTQSVVDAIKTHEGVNYEG